MNKEINKTLLIIVCLVCVALATQAQTKKTAKTTKTGTHSPFMKVENTAKKLMATMPDGYT